MNIENMKKLRAAVIAAGPKHFDMRHVRAERDCGTVMCFIGFAEMLADTEYPEENTEADEYLGLNRYEAERLFMPPGYYDRRDALGPFTFERGIRTLDHAIETGEVNWYQPGPEL